MTKTIQQGLMAGLEALVIEGQAKGEVIVFFHGYGADMHDLAPLGQVLKVPDQVTWVFPNGPLLVPIGPHMQGHAWFPIDEDALMKAMATGTHRDLSQITPPGFEDAYKVASKMISEMHVPPEKLILGGFSQGAMMATALALRMKENIKGLILLSGTLLSENEWTSLAKNHKDLSFFMSHGKSDPLLDFKAAQKLEKILQDGGLKGHLIAFDGEHEIPENVLRKLQEFLNHLFTSKSNPPLAPPLI
ncbi:alpha/beta hydrolase fold domain-containing protein [bacterium]|nr:alpha/beta hydrolase fold domain-containing protein [bacterium]